MKEQYAQIIEAIGEDLDRPGLKDTPLRAAKAMQFLCHGYNQSLDEIVNGALFDSDNDEMVIVKDIELYSLCEHHMLPFRGVAHIGYIPGATGRITGLSKLARLVEVYARRLQVQERLTSQIADMLMSRLEPRGVVTVLECEHMCMAMRGIQKAGARTITSAVRGVFQRDAKSRAEAMSLIIHS